MRSASLTFVVDADAFEGMVVTTTLVLYKIDSSDQVKVAVPKARTSVGVASSFLRSC